MKKKTDEKMDFVELVEKCKESGSLPGFAISNIPIPVFEMFMSDIQECYNGVYWAKIHDLMRKAEAYDYIVSMGFLCDKESVKDDDVGSGEVVTFTGQKLKR